MFRPLFRLATSEPQLLADHVEAYAALATSELRSASVLWRRRLALRLAGAAGLAVAVLLAGVALMLWAVIPFVAIDKPWVLVAVPLVPGLLGAWAWLQGAALPAGDSFALLRRQWAADAAMLREAST
jgi:hypothetical protein